MLNSVKATPARLMKEALRCHQVQNQKDSAAIAFKASDGSRLFSRKS
jgi:hypothetical protein